MTQRPTLYRIARRLGAPAWPWWTPKRLRRAIRRYEAKKLERLNIDRAPLVTEAGPGGY